MNQKKRPLYEALLAHINSRPVSFHVPGHKYGEVFPAAEGEYFRPLLQIDATELSGLDDLHSPEGPILEAEQLLADLYHVKTSFFLVNGSTAGNLAMIMAGSEENQIVLVQRNSHKSVLNALKLAKVKPIFLEPEYNAEWKIAAGVRLETVEQAFCQYPEAKALILTYPNYYGMTYELERMIELAHGRGIPVLVDEAHGPHFIVGSPFPHSATQLGADIVVQSAHKTLPAMTMGSFLHFNSRYINIEKLKEFLHIFQSSSPSYPIMASLDVGRSYLAEYAQRDLEYVVNKIQTLKDGLAGIPGIKVLDDSTGWADPLKLTIQSTSGLSGFSLQKKLEMQGIFTELADPYNVLFVFPLLKENQGYPIEETIQKVKTALKGSDAKPLKEIVPYQNRNKITSLAVSYQKMANLEEAEVPIKEAINLVAAETVIPYPPGIPLLLTGEKITSEKVENLLRLIENQARFQGGSLLKHGRLKIFRGI